MQEWVDLYQRFWSRSKNAQSCIITTARFSNSPKNISLPFYLEISRAWLFLPSNYPLEKCFRPGLKWLQSERILSYVQWLFMYGAFALRDNHLWKSTDGNLSFCFVNVVHHGKTFVTERNTEKIKAVVGFVLQCMESISHKCIICKRVSVIIIAEWPLAVSCTSVCIVG